MAVEGGWLALADRGSRATEVHPDTAPRSGHRLLSRRGQGVLAAAGHPHGEPAGPSECEGTR